MYVLTRFLIFNETRTGTVIDDPVLRLFNAVNLNILIFASVYFILIYGLIYLSFYPRVMMFAFQTYIVMVLMRMLVMFATPLEPPPGTIDLIDPVVIFMGTGDALRNDLFFSGHTATAFIFFLWAKKGINKNIFLALTVLIGLSVIIQKAHYTVDVIAAPVFTFAAYSIVKYIHK
jgi:membrane-associated phospholipid phosphatase